MGWDNRHAWETARGLDVAASDVISASVQGSNQVKGPWQTLYLLATRACVHRCSQRRRKVVGFGETFGDS